ncbi:vanillate O-demethylase ferredoxin subunit [Nocardioides luteus]|uniref:Flavodoxin n=1 Tax=Nocardioides luteus TaxID=1844 RepID=A0ABQ5SXV4_9ACTN|nr:PDR/VanB family oxidoreductase [Nocardioides luteus]MDR7312760.1 vanillate O-demethylase ferredoxin subunit [Nocardioides luteus]GGR47357.1 flavodoxin [Nocardioides luteus]GLJ69012.1 flavodoxin [Nocardioides luteus]
MAVNTQTWWQQGRVVEADDLAEGVRRIVLSPDRPVHATPGTHVDLRLDLDGHVRTRSYSVLRSEDGGRRLTLGVQLAPSSRGGSRHMHGLEVGDVVEMTGPVQSFPLGVGADRYVLVAGGIGVTALVAMADSLRRRGADYTLVLAGRRRAVMAYLEELADTHGDRIRVFVDDEGVRLDVDALVGEIAGGPAPARTEMYMCGPIRLMDAIRRAWVAHELPEPNLRFETFGSSGAWAAEEFVVHLPQHDRSVAVTTDTSMLDALEDAGVDVMWDCRKGECGICQVKVLDVDGRIDHRDVFLSKKQKETNTSLCLCVTRAARGEPERSEPAAVTLHLP